MVFKIGQDGKALIPHPVSTPIFLLLSFYMYDLGIKFILQEGSESSNLLKLTSLEQRS